MTLKQSTAIKDLLENVGKPVSRAMADAGYSQATAKNPDHLTDSKAWQEIMEKHLNDTKLFTKHEEALEATKWNDFTGEREEDHGIRLRAIDLAYKLKGRLKDGLNVAGDINMNIVVVRHADN